MNPQRPSRSATVAPSQHGDMHERLLRAAARVFDRKGYAAASVREIVAEAGITKPVLYYYFGSKEGILLSILEEGARRFLSAVSQPADRQGPARARLTELCEAVYDLFQQNVPVVRVAHAVYYGAREGVPDFDFALFDRSLQDAIRRIVEDGMASGELRAAAVRDVVTAVSGVIAVCADREIDPRVAPLGLEGLHGALDVLFEGLRAKDWRRAASHGAPARARRGAPGSPPLDCARSAPSDSRRAQAPEPGCGAEPHGGSYGRTEGEGTR